MEPTQFSDLIFVLEKIAHNIMLLSSMILIHAVLTCN